MNEIELCVLVGSQEDSQMVSAEYWNEGEGEDEAGDGVVNDIEHYEQSEDGSTVGDRSDWVP